MVLGIFESNCVIEMESSLVIFFIDVYENMRFLDLFERVGESLFILYIEFCVGGSMYFLDLFKKVGESLFFLSLEFYMRGF